MQQSPDQNGIDFSHHTRPLLFPLSDRQRNAFYTITKHVVPMRGSPPERSDGCVEVVEHNVADGTIEKQGKRRAASTGKRLDDCASLQIVPLENFTQGPSERRLASRISKWGNAVHGVIDSWSARSAPVVAQV